MEIKNSADLKAAILELEDRKQREKEELTRNFHAFTESLTPMNLLKSTFNKVKNSPGIQGSVLKAGLGLGVGLLSKQLLIGRSTGIVKGLLGNAFKMGVMNLVAKNTDTIKSTGARFLKTLFSRKK